MGRVAKLHGMCSHLVLAAAASLALVACGGGDSSPAPTATGSGNSGSQQPTEAISGTFQLAQSHVIAPEGAPFTFSDGDMPLTLVGGRRALVMVALDRDDAVSPLLVAKHNGTRLGTVALSAPSALPATAGGGAAYADNLYSATLPAEWVAPGVSLSVEAQNYLEGNATELSVGAASALDIRMLPFYLFGATEANTQPLSVTGDVSDLVREEMIAKWPIASVEAGRHPAEMVSLSTLVVHPRGDQSGVRQPAYAITSADQRKDGFAIMDSVLRMAAQMRSANGEAPTSTLYYAPVMAVNSPSMTFVNTGGGLGGGGNATGDHTQAGIFFHELGHAMGLAHAGDAYNNGTYPYVGGSLLGSSWAYDQFRGLLQSPEMPEQARNRSACETGRRQLDTEGRCYRQDPMQGGGADQHPSFRFSIHGDGNAARLQRWFEGVAEDQNGVRSYTGGRIFVNETEAPLYRRWDSLAQGMVEHQPQTTSGGLYGTDGGLPVQRDVMVHTILIDFSFVGTPGASRIYAPITYRGNLMRAFDPTSASDRAAFTIDSGTYYWYCKGRGCDYTVRVTYDDGTVIHRGLRGAFRNWFRPTEPARAEASDPTNGWSQRLWAINVPGDRPIARIELLDTPMAWQGIPANPTVLLSR